MVATKTTDRGSPSLFSIGWAYSNCAPSESDSRFIATVVVYEQVSNGGASEPEAPHNKVLDWHFVVDVHPKATTVTGDDVSGVLGLLSPWGSADDREAHDQFERALAEVQMWALYACLERAKKANGRSVILIEGPLLPKLRGRILYRMLDFERVSLYVVTSEPRWVRHLLKGSSLQGGAESGDGTTPRAGPAVVYEWTEPIPALALDASTREFVGRRLGNDELHVTVPANTLPARNASDFWSRCKHDLEQLFKSRQTLSIHGDVMLPSILCKAVKGAKDSRDAVLRSSAGETAVIAAREEPPAENPSAGGESIPEPVPRDVFGEPDEIIQPVSTDGEQLMLECTPDFFELPSDQHLRNYRNDKEVARSIFVGSREHLITALRSWTKTDRPTAAIALQRWSAYCKLSLAARKKGEKPTLPERRGEEEWRRIFGSKDGY
jgi:hypothetical protein